MKYCQEKAILIKTCEQCECDPQVDHGLQFNKVFAELSNPSKTKYLTQPRFSQIGFVKYFAKYLFAQFSLQVEKS